ncbi:hypothetical protein K1719_040528 [Acacia pycnantha]|nr:hypothetical protein K1719_040528 [Acacia pycnantha]
MKGDKYINADVAEVASKIDALEEQSSEGSFTPATPMDILSTVIGKPDYLDAPEVDIGGEHPQVASQMTTSKPCLPMVSRRIDNFLEQESRVDRSDFIRNALDNQGTPSANTTLSISCSPSFPPDVL